MTEDDIFTAITNHVKDGVDFITVHCGVTKKSVSALKKQNRLTGVVSRGGAFHAAQIIHTDEENPLYKNFDYLLEPANPAGENFARRGRPNPGSHPCLFPLQT